MPQLVTTLTMIQRRRLLIVLILSLIACVLMPLASAFFSGSNGGCHSVLEGQSSDELESGRWLPWSPQSVSDHPVNHVCDEEAVPMPPGYLQPAILWWMVLALWGSHTLVRSRLNPAWWGRPRRRHRQALRTHLTLSRIHV
jgi:hypothetical protein